MSEVMGERNVGWETVRYDDALHVWSRRDRSERWRPCQRNHEADKRGHARLVRRELQAAGTWVPKERDRLRCGAATSTCGRRARGYLALQEHPDAHL